MRPVGIIASIQLSKFRDRKWAGNNQRLKIVSMNDVVNSMMSNTRQKDTNYWSGWTNSHGFLVVKK